MSNRTSQILQLIKKGRISPYELLAPKCTTVTSGTCKKFVFNVSILGGTTNTSSAGIPGFLLLGTGGLTQQELMVSLSQ